MHVAINKSREHCRLAEIDLFRSRRHLNVRPHLHDLVAANQNVLVVEHAAGLRVEQMAGMNHFYICGRHRLRPQSCQSRQQQHARHCRKPFHRLAISSLLKVNPPREAQTRAARLHDSISDTNYARSYKLSGNGQRGSVWGKRAKHACGIEMAYRIAHPDCQDVFR